MALLPATGIPLNCGTISGTGVPSYNFDKTPVGQLVFRVTPFDYVTSSGTDTPFTDQDADLTQSVGADYITNFYTSVTSNLENEQLDTVIESYDSGVVLGCDGNAVASGVSAGTALLKASDVNDYNRFAFREVEVAETTGGTSNTWDGTYDASSFAYYLTDEVDRRAAAVTTPSTQKPIFSSYNHTTATYTRNTSLWITGVDITCYSVWNSNSAQNKAGTLVSPRHLIYANHYTYPNGTTVRFVDNSNNVVDRTIDSQVRVGTTDIQVAKLNSDVPAGISFAKVLPTGYPYRLPNLPDLQYFGDGFYNIPYIYSDQENKILCGNATSLLVDANIYPQGGSSGLKNNFSGGQVPVDYPDRYDLWENVISGDSGSPAFFIYDGGVVLLATWYYAFSGPSVAAWHAEVDAAMTTLGGGYTLTDADLSTYTAYDLFDNDPIP